MTRVLIEHAPRVRKTRRVEIMQKAGRDGIRRADTMHEPRKAECCLHVKMVDGEREIPAASTDRKLGTPVTSVGNANMLIGNPVIARDGQEAATLKEEGRSSVKAKRSEAVQFYRKQEKAKSKAGRCCHLWAQLDPDRVH